MHAIDSESDHACQTNIPSENISLQITTLLLVSGAVITPETQHWANQSYGGNKILALFSTYHT